MAGNWLNYAGGAAKGFVEGREDMRKSEEADMRKKEFEALQKQRKRVEEEQAKDDALEARQKQVRGAGKYTDAVPGKPQESVPGFVGPPSGTKAVTVTPADEARARAAIAGAGGRTKDFQAQATFQTQATALDQAARVEKLEQAKSVLAEAGRLRATGNLAGAARLLQTEYAKHPDGHEIVIGEENGVQTIGVAGPDGKYAQRPVPLTAEAVDAMIAQGHNMLNSENYYKSQDLGIKRDELGVHKITAEAARTNAEANLKKALFDAGPDAQKQRDAWIRYHDAIGKAALMRAGHEGAAANAARFGPAIPFVDDATGKTVYMTRVSDAKTGKSTWQREDMPTGLTPFTKPKELTDVQNAKLKIWQKKVDNNGFKSSVEEESALSDILDPTQSFISKAKAAEPGGGVGPPAPTPAEKTATASAAAAKAQKEKDDARQYRRSLIRGGWDYTLAPRGGGKTKAEWAALDAAEGRR